MGNRARWEGSERVGEGGVLDHQTGYVRVVGVGFAIAAHPKHVAAHEPGLVGRGGGGRSTGVHGTGGEGFTGRRTEVCPTHHRQLGWS